jgi:single-strand DNA-binding protein
MARDLNKVLLIGNLTHDPELRQTDAGHPVCGFRLATKRVWTDRAGAKQEATQYHRIIAWNQVAEICGKYLKKGRRVYVEGRLTNREYEQDGEKRSVSEVVVDDLILLDAKPKEGPSDGAVVIAEALGRSIVPEEELKREIPF